MLYLFSLSHLLHSVWQTLDSTTSLQMVQFHSFLWLSNTPVFLPGKSRGQRSLAGYSPWDCKRVRHNLATKQQQQNIFFRHLKGQSCTSLECTHHNSEVTARSWLMSTVPLHGHQRVAWVLFLPQTSILPIKGTQALTAFLFLFFTILIIKLKYINTQAHF